jgi:membrane protein required for colicin V production
MVNSGDWNGLDWALAGIVALSTVRAFMGGLIQALFGLLGFVGGFELASWNYVAAGDWVYDRGWLRSLSTARILSFLVITVLTVAAFELIGRGVKKTAHSIGLGPFDHMMGAAFGVARGLLIGVALIVAVTAFAPPEWIDGSKLTGYFLGAAHAVSFTIPHGL